MTAGSNIRGTIWRITFPTDDSVGGALATGTPVYENVSLRLQASTPDQAFVQQGLETLRAFEAILRPATMVIQERDELEVTWPYTHRFYGERLRVAGVTESDFHPQDKRGYIVLSLTRSERAHTNV